MIRSQALAACFRPPLRFNTVQYYYDPLIKNPYSMQWQFGVERQVDSSTTLSVSLCRIRNATSGHRGVLQRRAHAGPRRPPEASPLPLYRCHQL